MGLYRKWRPAPEVLLAPFACAIPFPRPTKWGNIGKMKRRKNYRIKWMAVKRRAQWYSSAYHTEGGAPKKFLNMFPRLPMLKLRSIFFQVNNTSDFCSAKHIMRKLVRSEKQWNERITQNVRESSVLSKGIYTHTRRQQYEEKSALALVAIIAVRNGVG